MAAAAAHGRVRGAVTDDSGSVLPGVVVVATSGDEQVLGTAVTDETGAYAFNALPAGPVRLTFQLEGFATAVDGLTIEAGSESRLDEQLAVASVAETVIVYGRAPVDPPAPPPPPPPPPVVIAVPVHDRESICGPAKPGAREESFGTIRSHRYEADRGLYTKDDQLTINGGTLNGLEVGQNLVVRRHFRVSGGAGAAATGEHTSGLVQIVAADDRLSTAVVVYACDELRKGDFLASFNPEPVRIPDPAGIPAFDDAARILFADAGQMLGAPRRLMVIDHGSDAGIRVGQRLTLFRRPRRGGATPAIVGEAVVVAIRADSATIRVEQATDAIAFGEWAAPQRQSSGDSPASAPLQSPRNLVIP
jgi:Carboxypeptidase regulatory-like domain